MHEQSIVEAILATALERAAKEKASKIIRIYLVIGELSGVLDEAVEFYWDFLTKDTIAAGSNLFFMRPPTEVRCRNCNTVFSPENLNVTCPNCKERKIEIISGRELFIESMEVE